MNPREKAARRKARIAQKKREDRALAKAAGLFKKPQPGYKKLVAALDELFSLFVRLRGKYRTGGKCEVCFTRDIYCAFHWIPRGNMGIRWDPLNAVAGCKGCNYNERMTRGVMKNGANGKYKKLFIERHGEEAWDDLEARAERKWDPTELAELLRRIKDVYGGAKDDDYVIIQRGYYDPYLRGQEDRVGTRPVGKHKDVAAPGLAGDSPAHVRQEPGPAQPRLPDDDGRAGAGAVRPA